MVGYFAAQHAGGACLWLHLLSPVMGECFEGRAGRYSCYAKSRADRIRNPMPGPVPPDHAASRLATVRVCASCVQEGSGETPWPSLSTPPPIKAIPALPAPGVGAGWGYFTFHVRRSRKSSVSIFPSSRSFCAIG